MQKNIYNKKVLLYSGGMDSWLIDKLWKPDVKLYVDMGTPYAVEEIRRLPNDVIVEHLNLSAFEREDKIIPLRNLYLVALATNYGNEICLGATAGDRVLDKSYEFGVKCGELLTHLYGPQHWTEQRTIKVNLDFKQYTKTELVRMFLERGGDINEALQSSFSCYFPQDGRECWSCKPCFRKFIAFALNGCKFSDEVVSRNIDYINREILPLINLGTYGRAEEEAEIMRVLNYYK